MLFNSYEFILFFLPVTLLGYFSLGKRGLYQAAIVWLVLASLFFYAWWNPVYLALILLSIAFNYFIGLQLVGDNTGVKSRKRVLLVFGIGANLTLLGYFKYANFFVDNINVLLDADIVLQTIILPLAISFFTFQQISYLVDAYQNITQEHDFSHYCLFVSFFPQLIAGPIVHHKEMLPQFQQEAIFRPSYSRLSVGMTIFIIGLFKKVMIADSIARYATEVFNAANQITLSFFEAWRGAFAYSFQIYFDFSGYSDMAIGLAFMFGIVLPINFNSPYKSHNIIEFWRRWHITLSRFLKDYLYIPLGGNRKGQVRRYVNLLITMLLGGLWHGAAWTYVVWGALHGLYLSANHIWHHIKRRLNIFNRNSTKNLMFSRLLTFILITFAWVYFRADDLSSANHMVKSMLGLNGFVWPDTHLSPTAQAILSQLNWKFSHLGYFSGWKDIVIILLLLATVWFMPNTQEIIGKYRPSIENQPLSSSALSWSPTKKWAAIISVIALISILNLAKVSEFLYFQF